LLFYGIGFLRIITSYLSTKVNHYNLQESKDKGFIILVLIAIVNLFYTDYLAYIGTLDKVIGDWLIYMQTSGTIAIIISIVLLIVSYDSLGSSFKIGIEEQRKVKFVKTGVYRYCRHPIYLSMLLFSTSVFLLLPAVLTLILLAGNSAALIVTAKKEEKYLAEEHAGYQGYMRKTGFLFPHLSVFFHKK
jgi:protein-S-isoprenylcysteine O-methyltransferase Ste14